MQNSFVSHSRNNIVLPSYNTRNLSFEKALSRSKINAKELTKVLNLNKINKKYAIRNSLIKSESSYNNEVDLKLIKVGNILGRIPHPKRTTQTNENILIASRIPIRATIMQRNNSAHNIKAKANTHDIDDYLIHFQQAIQNILSSSRHFVLNTYQFSTDSKKQKFKKLNTIYKYISDEQTTMKFHFFKEDFKQKGLNNRPVVNPEYKFIKIRDDSFLVLSTFKKVINCIIEHFFMAYNNDMSFKKVNLATLNEYNLYLKEIYELYKKESKDIVKNYSILTKGLVNSDKLYFDYVNELSKYCEECTKEEVIFLRSYNEMMKTETII